MEQRLESGGLPVAARVRLDPSEESTRPIGKFALWVRYYESPDYPQIPSPDACGVSQERLMVFHCLTDVLDLRNHEQALTIHTAAIGLLSNFCPGVAGVKTPLIVKRDRFERQSENRWQYRADFEILTEHGYLSELPNDFILPEVLEIGIFNDAAGEVGDTTNKDAEVLVNIPRPVRVLPKTNFPGLQ